MSWRDELDSEDDLTRILAVGRAGREGGPELIDALLDLALHDPTEVQTTGGMAEVWQHVSDAAASALRGILDRHGGGVDERIRAAALDPGNHDGRAGTLLRRLGKTYQPVRDVLAVSPEEGLRIRAIRAGAPAASFLGDPSPGVRVEALTAGAPPEGALTDPVAEVRLAAARRPLPDSAAVLAAARAETDPEVREALARSLVRFRLTDAVWVVLRGYLVNGTGAIRTEIAKRLERAGDTGVSAAIAARALIDIDERELLWIVESRPRPELRALVEHLHEHAPVNYLRYATGKALEADPAPDRTLPAADRLDDVQRARLLREVLRWAEAALGSEASDGLRAWTAAPDDHTAAQWIVEHDWFGDGPQAALLHAAVDGDLERALAVELRPGREAGLLRMAHRFTAGQIRAGLTPITPGPLNPLLLLGPDALRVQSVAVALGASVRLSLALRPEEPASLVVSCAGCGTPVRVGGDVTWRYRDDDRVAAFEDGYTGELTGSCPACGTAARREVRVSETTRRFTLERELSWDAVG